jgi:hypothetical protein
MATSEQIGSVTARSASAIELLIAIAGPIDDGSLRERMAAVATMLPGGLRIGVASPAASQAEAADVAETPEAGIRFLRYPLASSAQAALPWLASPAAYTEIARLATSIGTARCVVIGPDLAALTSETIDALARPLADGAAQLAVPVYPTGKHEGLLNSGILYPFTRALYGKDVRHPFAVDFGIGSGMIARLSSGSQRETQTIASPAVDAAVSGQAIAQVYVGTLHTPHHEGIELSTVLGRLCGAVFESAEKNAASWQRIRGYQPAAVQGSAAASLDDGDAIDVRPLIESFSLGFRNLREVWGLVLPPVTLLELQRLTRLPPEHFVLSDSLWARVVYDFALAHRLRTISRAHLLGAMTPLYLGWVASHTAEIAAMDASEAEQRIERLAKAYEQEKSYFVSRWRWPDRFNP